MSGTQRFNKQVNKDSKLFIKAHETPKVLLLGNGLNRCFGGMSWTDLIYKFPNGQIIPQGSNIPMPMQIILATDGEVSTNLQKEKESMYGSVPNKEFSQVLNSLLSICFDDILTTNYSYELEQVILGNNQVSNHILKNLSSHTSAVSQTDVKYLLHSFNKVKDNRIWHIHGEARKPDSIIIGHYYYGKLLWKIQSHIDKKCVGNNSYLKCRNHGRNISIDSWVDPFILGDVYVLGFGFDLSELDLWWLLNRKKKEKANPHGKVYFYEPRLGNKFDERIRLLQLMDVEVIDCGIEILPSDKDKDKAFRMFYQKAIADISKRIK